MLLPLSSPRIKGKIMQETSPLLKTDFYRICASADDLTFGKAAAICTALSER
jgi:hypothetical protein